MTKQFDIHKSIVVQAFKLVKANAGAAGIDRQSLEDFEKNLKGNLYKIWNRMSSGSYFPPPVRAVPIPKKMGGERILGIPTIGDRVAQAVVKLYLEPRLDPHFLQDSYGYRPNKSALDAIEVTRKRCWRYDWVLEFDIKGLFDNIPHELLMKAVKKHTDCKWVLLCIERWLNAPMVFQEGGQVARDKGTPQGGVISPLLSNLFMHYAFDLWMKRTYPDNPWCRYADDGLVHLKTEQEALNLLAALKDRFERCGLQLHSEKTRIVYCSDANRKKRYPNKSFDFLGYTFRPRESRNTKKNIVFTSFTPAVSKRSLNAMRAKVRKMNVRNRTDLSLEEIAKWFNPILWGWLNYYGQFCRSGLDPLWRHFNKTLVAWIMRKYKRLQRYRRRTVSLLEKILESNPVLFVHWQIGIKGSFA